MQQSISFSLIIIPLCQTKLEKSSLNVISFSVRSSPARFSPPRSERSLQTFSCKVFTSSTGKIASEVLLQGFHLLDRADRFKPSHARFSPPRPGRSFQTFSSKAFSSSVRQIVSNLLWQCCHLLDRKSDASCNSLLRYAFWLKTPYTGYGTLVETPDFR